MSENNQTDQFNTPILFIVFNRPDLTKKVFAEIKKVKLKQLFIAADGPRSGNASDAIKCQEVRDYLLANIDWQCDLQTLFRSDNLGCGLSCAGAVDWFFEQIEEGIIIEDDCLPDSSFFVFCSEMLDRYRHQERIMHITGVYSGEPYLSQYSYYFSQIAPVGAWASWRRAWLKYDYYMKSWPDFLKEQQIRNLFNKKIQQDFWNWNLNALYLEKLKGTWDVQWAYDVMRSNGLVIHSGVNLVTNIGFTVDATHSSNAGNILSNKDKESMEFPLRHPVFIIENKLADDHKNRYIAGAVWYNFGIKRFLRDLGLFRLVKSVAYFLKRFL